MKIYNPKPSTIIMASTFTFLTAAVVLLSIFTISLMDMVAKEQRARIWDTKLIYACYNHKVYPCDEEGVSEWNKRNPDEAITSHYLRDPEL